MALLLVRDVHARRATAALARLAGAEAQVERDGLTGWSSRVGLEVALQRLAEERPRPVGVVFVDLDGLKQVNDTHGHDAGDVLLREAARRLRRSARSDDLVARLGGDEVVLLTPGLGAPDTVARLAREVLDALARPVFGPGGAPLVDGIRASVGVAIAADPRGVTEALVRADHAMYAAKTGGGSAVVVDGAPEDVLEPSRGADPIRVKVGAVPAED